MAYERKKIDRDLFSFILLLGNDKVELPIKILGI